MGTERRQKFATVNITRIGSPIRERVALFVLLFAWCGCSRPPPRPDRRDLGRANLKAGRARLREMRAFVALSGLLAGLHAFVAAGSIYGVNRSSGCSRRV